MPVIECRVWQPADIFHPLWDAGQEQAFRDKCAPSGGDGGAAGSREHGGDANGAEERAEERAQRGPERGAAAATAAASAPEYATSADIVERNLTALVVRTCGRLRAESFVPATKYGKVKADVNRRYVREWAKDSAPIRERIRAHASAMPKFGASSPPAARRVGLYDA